VNFYTGKILGVVFGFLTLGVIGALVGFLVGHLFDSGLVRAIRMTGPGALHELQQEFFDIAFVLLGYIAKADGRVSESEVAQAEAMFAQLRLTPSQRASAIKRFQRGAEKDYDPSNELAQFRKTASLRPQTSQTLMLFLVSMALADGRLDRAERDALTRIAHSLGISDTALQHIVSMLSAQANFRGRRQDQRQTYQPQRSQLSDAYQALGVSSEVDDRELKRAYRRLMSENHPDKLGARGVPKEMIDLATERSQNITAAYDLIKESRGLK
jgi:DnaJ like chaperone protein